MRYSKSFDPTTSTVQQRFKTDVDINQIVARSRNLRQPLPSPQTQGFFGDFTEIDFASMQNTVSRAVEGFQALPSHIRVRFANSPINLINFVKNEGNREEAIKLGLIPKPAVQAVPVSPLDVTGTTDTKQGAV